MDKPVIHIKHLENVCWKNQDHAFLIDHSTDVWRIHLDLHLQFINNLWPLLNPDEQERASRFRRESIKQTFIISRGYLRLLLAKYTGIPAAEIGFEIGKNGKPHIKSIVTGRWHYNISHSTNYILIAVADRDVGIDVENNDKVLHYYQDIMNISFSEVEINDVETSDKPAKNFYKLWTRKEALLKATAKGIDNDLHLIPSLDGEHITETSIIDSNLNWLVSSFDVDENYTGALASNNAKVNFIDLINL